VVTRWTFDDIDEVGPSPYTYTVAINPNEGGSPTVEKTLAITSNTGPNRGAIVQEGQSSPPQMQFSGVILVQEHFEALEAWFDRRILIEITDDLGRKFRGVFSGWAPQRIRRAFNPWYHQYQATFTILGYKTASGVVRFGKFTR
jgi:hypothetical protein